MKEIVNDLRNQIANNSLKLPTQPEIAVKIREVENDPKIKAEVIAAIISKDPGLTARIIKIANSPLMRGKVQINSLPMAINRLGYKFVCNTTTGLAMEQIFQTTHDLVDRLMYEVWKDSASIAAIAYVVAKQYSTISPDVASLAGLMHKIGILPILRYAQEKEVLLEDEQQLTDIIDKFFPKLSEAILYTWEFPEEITSVPRQVFQGKQASGEHQQLADIICVANCIHHQRLGHEVDTEKYAESFKRLNLDTDFDFMDSVDFIEDLNNALSIYNSSH